MSKELNIIEVSKIPNSEFEVYYSDGYKSLNTFTDNKGNLINSEGEAEECDVNFINAKFIPI